VVHTYNRWCTVYGVCMVYGVCVCRENSEGLCVTVRCARPPLGVSLTKKRGGLRPVGERAETTNDLI